MECPECHKDIEFILAYSTSLFEGIFNEEGELIGFENPIHHQPETFVCPECDKVIPVKLSKDFKWRG